MDDQGEILRALGQIEGKIDAIDNHVKAVSAKAGEVRKALDEHKLDQEAHGQGGERRGSGAVIVWISLAIAVGSLLISLVHK